MCMTVCEKCKGPIGVENGKNVCVLCGEVYGDACEDVVKDYNAFFENVSLEKFRRISKKIADLIAYSSSEAYMIARLSNGQFYTNFTPKEGYNSVYRGQCAVENWYDVKKIYEDEEYSVAIAEDGSLQPTLVEVEELFERIKGSGISDMRMKDVLWLSYEYTFQSLYTGEITVEDSFLGLDINGKVIMYNPFRLFFPNIFIFFI